MNNLQKGALFLSIVVAIAIASFASPRQSAQAALSAGSAAARADLTPQGHLLWNLESLLVSAFGHKEPSVSGNPDVSEDFTCAGECSPLATFSPYLFTFTHLGKSDLKVSNVDVLKLNFGNYPVPVLIRGKAISCGGAKFLTVNRATSSFSLMCLAPQA
jgi:hypothetical protein